MKPARRKTWAFYTVGLDICLPVAITRERMMKVCGKKLVWFLCLLLCLVVAAPFTFAEEQYRISGNDLRRLIAISERLKALNNQLSSELTISKENLMKLQSELMSCKQDLTALEKQLEISRDESTALQLELAKARASLTQALESFGEYKLAVAKRERTLKIQRNVAALVAVVALII